MRAWARRQLYSFFSSLGSLMAHRIGTLMTVLVLGIAMALPLGLYVTINNLNRFDIRQDEWGAMTVFLQKEVTGAEAEAFAQEVNQREDASVVTITPEEGMEEFRKVSGFGKAMDLFEENPLPWVLLVTPRLTAGEELGDRVATLASWLAVQEVVDTVQVDHKWMQRLSGLLELGQAFVTVLTIVFSLAVVVVVANTIRLDVANRAEEIQVLSLVGAADGFIRQPFLYSGFWYGLLGALLALILLTVSIFYLQGPLERLLEAYGNEIRFEGFTGQEGLIVLFAGGFLGLGGAWVSVQRYLRQLKDGGMLGRN
jgi:cell division transport system permease protein